MPLSHRYLHIRLDIRGAIAHSRCLCFSLLLKMLYLLRLRGRQRGHLRLRLHITSRLIL